VLDAIAATTGAPRPRASVAAAAGEVALAAGRTGEAVLLLQRPAWIGHAATRVSLPPRPARP